MGLLPWGKTASRDEQPPRIPFRCGTLPLAIETVEAWERQEREYIEWVHAHPAPRPEWISVARQLKAVHSHKRQ